MRITLLGVLGALAVAALVVYIASELHQRTVQKHKPEPPPTNPGLPPINP